MGDLLGLLVFHHEVATSPGTLFAWPTFCRHDLTSLGNIRIPLREICHSLVPARCGRPRCRCRALVAHGPVVAAGAAAHHCIARQEASAQRARHGVLAIWASTEYRAIQATLLRVYTGATRGDVVLAACVSALMAGGGLIAP